MSLRRSGQRVTGEGVVVRAEFDVSAGESPDAIDARAASGLDERPPLGQANGGLPAEPRGSGALSQARHGSRADRAGRGRNSSNGMSLVGPTSSGGVPSETASSGEGLSDSVSLRSGSSGSSPGGSRWTQGEPNGSASGGGRWNQAESNGGVSRRAPSSRVPSGRRRSNQAASSEGPSGEASDESESGEHIPREWPVDGAARSVATTGHPLRMSPNRAQRSARPLTPDPPASPHSRTPFARRFRDRDALASESDRPEAHRDVHIVIGHVEVRAISGSTPSPRPASKSPPTLSLDEYLRGRNGGRRCEPIHRPVERIRVGKTRHPVRGQQAEGVPALVDPCRGNFSFFQDDVVDVAAG